MKAPKNASEKKTRDASGKWLKGVSQNPGGRPKGGWEFSALARGHSLECLERLMFWVRSSKERASVMACRIVLERGYGIAPAAELLLQPQESDGTAAIQVTFVPAPKHFDDDDAPAPRANGHSNGNGHGPNNNGHSNGNYVIEPNGSSTGWLKH